MLRSILKLWQEDADQRCRELEGQQLFQAQGEAKFTRMVTKYLDEEAAKRVAAADLPTRSRLHALRDVASLDT